MDILTCSIYIYAYMETTISLENGNKMLRLISANQISFRFITRKISSYLYALFLHSRTYIKFCIILMMIFDKKKKNYSKWKIYYIK